MYICHIFFIHSSVNRHLGCFHILATVNNATANMGVQMFEIVIFISLERIPQRTTARSHGSSIFYFFEKSSYCFLQRLYHSDWCEVIPHCGFVSFCLFSFLLATVAYCSSKARDQIQAIAANCAAAVAVLDP